jgi:sulfoxide reductase catalytic subunit YedY
MNRRKFLAAGTMGVAALPFVGPFAAEAGVKLSGIVKSPLSTSEAETPYDAVTGYNNFYEFGTGKNDPVKLAKNFQTSPWTVSIDGEVAKPNMQ